MHLKAFLDGFFVMRRTQLAATTRQNYSYCAAKLLAHFGPERIVEELAAADLRAFAATLEAHGLSPRSVHDNLAICSAFWTFAAAEFGIANVVRSVPRPKWKPRQIEPFAEDEVRALVRAAEWSAPWTGRNGKPARSRRPTAARDMAIVMVLVDTGVRASELCAFERRDYDASEARLRIRHGKGDKERNVYLGAVAQKALWRYLNGRQIKAADPLFATREGTALDRNNLRHMLVAIGRSAGVSHVHPHRFRHTFAVVFLRNGGNVYELQRLLGHEDLETVKVYLQLAETDLAAAQRKASPADGWKL